MRLKKGFTLAEILIVLMVIGVIATMTIPALMKGVTEAQFKTAYKKAFNTIVNLAAMERIAGALPTKAQASDALTFFGSMNNNLSVKEYALNSKCAPDAGMKDDCRGSVTGVKVGGTNVYGDSSANQGVSSIGKIANPSDWIITEDGLAYAVALGEVEEGNDCATKQGINATPAGTDPATNACLIVIVDVNGLAKGPNRFEGQKNAGANKVGGGIGTNWINGGTETTKMDTLVGDQYIIYVGSDGATAGPRLTTISGRIVGDMK